MAFQKDPDIFKAAITGSKWKGSNRAPSLGRRLRRNNKQLAGDARLNSAIQVYFQKKFVAAQNTGPMIEHIRNGVPLTAHGAKLLGVAWPLQN